MSVGDNIKRIRQSRDLTQEEFGKIADVSSMAVSQWENDRAVPRMGAVQRISDYFGIPKSDIIDDDALLTNLPKGAIIPTVVEDAFLPLRGRVHAGDAQEPDSIEGEILVPNAIAKRHPKGYFLEVEGNCMNRVYPEGCYILIDPEKKPQNGSIAVVSIDGADYVMRRLYRGANSMMLSPDSWDDSYEDIVITPDSGRTVEFVGTVVWFQSSREME